MDNNSSTVDLVPSDIPGAELSKPWEQHPMVALRWWLLCRGISVPTTWKKAKLIERYVLLLLMLLLLHLGITMPSRSVKSVTIDSCYSVGEACILRHK